MIPSSQGGPVEGLGSWEMPVDVAVLPPQSLIYATSSVLGVVNTSSGSNTSAPLAGLSDINETTTFGKHVPFLFKSQLQS